jgi:hypothetical protein
MVNTVELEDGEQLCLEVQDRVQKAVAPKLDWKHAHKQQEQNNARASKHKRTEASQNVSTVASVAKRHKDGGTEGLGRGSGSGKGNGGP